MAGLLAAMAEYGLNSGLILTEATRKTYAHNGRAVEVYPTVEWLQRS